MTQIKATIIADSITESKIRIDRITTFELEYPRFIHAELMTHRMFSRNAASSRAIPIEKMIEHVTNNVAMPVYWGSNQPGMQAGKELEGVFKEGAIDIWKAAALEAARWSKSLHNQKVHKQIANRVTEPFQIMKTIVTATEYDNWYSLRDHKAAQPEIRELAIAMADAEWESVPKVKQAGEWHLPYVDTSTSNLSIEDALVVSASCCAQVSYRKNDDSLEKAVAVYERLVGSYPIHASPLEHQAKAMDLTKQWEEGTTHQDSTGQFWSGNFCGWIQHRHLLGH